jgi:hypothetical protein
LLPLPPNPLTCNTTAPVTGNGVSVPILLYHRLGPAVVDGMTIKTSVFEEHLRYLRNNGYKVIRLRQLVDWYLKERATPSCKVCGYRGG